MASRRVRLGESSLLEGTLGSSWWQSHSLTMSTPYQPNCGQGRAWILLVLQSPVPGRAPELCGFSMLPRPISNLPKGITLPVGTRSPALSPVFSGEAPLGQPSSSLLGSLLGMSADVTDGDESIPGKSRALRPKESAERGAQCGSTCP